MTLTRFGRPSVPDPPIRSPTRKQKHLPIDNPRSDRFYAKAKEVLSRHSWKSFREAFVSKTYPKGMEKEDKQQ